MNNRYHHRKQPNVDNSIIDCCNCVMVVLSDRLCTERFIDYWIESWLGKIIPQGQSFNGVNFRQQFIYWPHRRCIMCNKVSNAWSTIWPRHQAYGINIWTVFTCFLKILISSGDNSKVKKMRDLILKHISCKTEVFSQTYKECYLPD